MTALHCSEELKLQNGQGECNSNRDIQTDLGCFDKIFSFFVFFLLDCLLQKMLFTISQEKCNTNIWLTANERACLAIEDKVQAECKRLLKGRSHLWSALLLVHGACQHCRM